MREWNQICSLANGSYSLNIWFRRGKKKNHCMENTKLSENYSTHTQHEYAYWIPTQTISHIYPDTTHTHSTQRYAQPENGEKTHRIITPHWTSLLESWNKNKPNVQKWCSHIQCVLLAIFFVSIHLLCNTLHKIYLHINLLLLFLICFFFLPLFICFNFSSLFSLNRCNKNGMVRTARWKEMERLKANKPKYCGLKCKRVKCVYRNKTANNK